jgi:seryl-tRNA synthetase
MLDINFIRENKDIVQAGSVKKRIPFDVHELLAKDEERKALLQTVEAKRAEQNEVGKRIPQVEGEEKAQLLQQMSALKEVLQKEEEQLKVVQEAWKQLMLRVPNVPHISVPEGKDDTENVEIRTWGEKPQFTFTPKDHVELCKINKLVDFERGTKIAGFRGYILKNYGALLDMAVRQFTMDSLLKKGYAPMTVPSLVNESTLFGTGYLPQGEDDLYKTQDGDYLAGTGEVATMSYFSDEVLDAKQLPIKIIAQSPCFRREAGSHGRDTKGLIRVHEFYKLEQIVIAEASHEATVALHEEITQNAEDVMQALNIPYHVVNICGGDLGLGQVKKYDIEAWVPSQDTYRETHSASYFHDFQARRLNIKYVGEDGKKYFAYSLNNTAIASPRILVPIIENNQQEDGSIVVPEVLRPYMGGVEVIKMQ